MSKNQKSALIVLLVGAVLWFLPPPAGVTVLGWHLAAVFIATVVGFILHPLPIGAVAFIAITFSVLTGLLSTKDALAGYGNSTIWLIVCAFLYSRGFIKSGLGRRIAFAIIRAIGKSALSLGYAIAFSELIISPATPSATARGGGIMYPIVQSLAKALGSEPGETAKKIGTYLIQVGYHSDAVTCTMFVTSMAGNPLCVALAAKALGVEITWMDWALAAIVPGLLALLLVPYVMLKLTKPDLVSIPHAKELAQKELTAMGPMSKAEKYLLVIFLGSLFFWATSGLTHIGATPVAMTAVCIMVIVDVINWQDVIKEKGAWDAMFWMGGLMALATVLAKSGFIKWAAAFIADGIADAHMGWISSFLIISLIYIYSHYCFASVTASISAMYAAFGAVPVYFGTGYVSQSEWWRNGFIVCTVNTVVWLTVGMTWWKLIGLW